MTDQPEPPRATRFDRLFGMLALLAAPDDAEALAVELTRVASDDGCILEFDWPAFGRKAAAYLRPERLRHANLETCRKLLTTLVRQDRFAQGSLAEHITSGSVARVVRRMAELLTCPACSASDPIPIVYGRSMAELSEQSERGEIALGGCCIPDHPPRWRCRACREDF